MNKVKILYGILIFIPILYGIYFILQNPYKDISHISTSQLVEASNLYNDPDISPEILIISPVSGSKYSIKDEIKIDFSVADTNLSLNTSLDGKSVNNVDIIKAEDLLIGNHTLTVKFSSPEVESLSDTVVGEEVTFTIVPLVGIKGIIDNNDKFVNFIIEGLGVENIYDKGIGLVYHDKVNDTETGLNSEDGSISIGDYDEDNLPELRVDFNKDWLKDILNTNPYAEFTLRLELNDGTILNISSADWESQDPSQLLVVGLKDGIAQISAIEITGDSTEEVSIKLKDEFGDTITTEPLGIASNLSGDNFWVSFSDKKIRMYNSCGEIRNISGTDWFWTVSNIPDGLDWTGSELQYCSSETNKMYRISSSGAETDLGIVSSRLSVDGVVTDSSSVNYTTQEYEGYNPRAISGNYLCSANKIDKRFTSNSNLIETIPSATPIWTNEQDTPGSCAGMTEATDSSVPGGTVIYISSINGNIYKCRFENKAVTSPSSARIRMISHFNADSYYENLVYVGSAGRTQHTPMASGQGDYNYGTHRSYYQVVGSPSSYIEARVVGKALFSRGFVNVVSVGQFTSPSNEPISTLSIRTCTFNPNWDSREAFNNPVLGSQLISFSYDGLGEIVHETSPRVRVASISGFLPDPLYLTYRYGNEGQTYSNVATYTEYASGAWVALGRHIVSGSGYDSFPIYLAFLTNNGSLTVLNQLTSPIPVPQGLAMGKLDIVESVQFEAKDSPLDICPNNGGNRIFPDKQNPEDTTDRSKVKVRAKISPKEQGIKVYFKSFDVDDPSSDTSPIDSNGSSGDDNRGNVNNKKEGELSAPFALTDTNGIVEVELQVTMQPGDNFRIAASCNQIILTNMTELATDEVRATDMLTVWRRLHVELDSMGSVVNNNATGKILGISKYKRRVDIDGIDLIMNGEAMPTLNDSSWGQGPPPFGNGRFENGNITIGTDATLFKVDSNGDLFLNMIDTITVPFVIKKGNNVKEGNLIQLRKVADQSIIDVTDITMTPNEFNDGTITIAGVTYDVEKNNPANKVFTKRGDIVRIGFVLHDDDDDTILPKFPHIGLLDNALTPAYVRPVFDVGDNNLNVPFVANVPLTNPDIVTAQDWDSKPLNKDDFWVAYVLEGFQGATFKDGDPNTEYFLGVTMGVTAADLGGSLIFLEVHQTHEGITNPTIEEQITVVHEIGHAVGRKGSEDENVTDEVGNYTAGYINYIRSSPRPWT